jgi:hypothetical protein
MNKLSMSQTLTYQIKIPGIVGDKWLSWGEKIIIKIEQTDKKYPLTTLTGKLDQAALFGLWRQIYSLGLPIISVICLDYSGATNSDE